MAEGIILGGGGGGLKVHFYDSSSFLMPFSTNQYDYSLGKTIKRENSILFFHNNLSTSYRATNSLIMASLISDTHLRIQTYTNPTTSYNAFGGVLILEFDKAKFKQTGQLSGRNGNSYTDIDFTQNVDPNKTIVSFTFTSRSTSTAAEHAEKRYGEISATGVRLYHPDTIDTLNYEILEHY